MSKRTLPSKLLNTIIIILLLFINTPLSVFADEHTMQELSYDFDTLLSEWGVVANGSLSIDNQNYCTGSSSLKIMGRSNFFNGPSLNTTNLIAKNEPYSVSLYVYHEGNETITFRATARFTSNNNTDEFRNIGQTDIPPNTWTNISGSFTSLEDYKASIIYIECTNETINFNIDDFHIKGLLNIGALPSVTQPAVSQAVTDSSTVQNENIITTVSPVTNTNNPISQVTIDFENGNYNKLFSINNASIKIVSDYSYLGKASLLVSGRKSSADPLKIQTNFLEDKKDYSYNAYIMYNDKDAPERLNFYTLINYVVNGKSLSERISSEEIQKNSWSKVSGTIKLPKKATDITLAIYTENNSEQMHRSYVTNFYIDNVSFKNISVSPIKTIIILLIIICTVTALVIITLKVLRRWKKKKISNQTIIELAMKDKMTNTLNRNAYQKFLEDISKEPDKIKSLYFAVCDVNFLKYANDNIGHEAGDKIICKCARLATENIEGDVFRTGGDEFLCVSYKPFKEHFKKVIDEASSFEKDNIFSVAVGFSEYSPDIDGDTPDIKQILERADKEMYLDKKRCKEKNPDLCNIKKDNQTKEI